MNYKYFLQLSFEDRHFRGKVAPRGFYQIYEYFDRDVKVYCVWYLVPLVKLAQFIEKLWWKPAILLKRRGYLRVEQGERCHWFWLSKIRLKKI